ncbi:MAG: nuclear transport factor 2 family protein [Clostridium sp.]|nr:nuclear transport factor 2 family protein [Clostridium sp.]
MDDKEKIENCYCQMYCGMVDKNPALLSEVLDKSFVLVHMTGMRQSKEEFIRAVENGTLNYYSAKHQHMEVEVQGEQAHLTGQSVVNAAVFGGGRHTWRLQLKLSLVRNGDTWQIIEAQASTY